MNLKAIVSSVLSGILAAVIVDINAWSKATGPAPFDWGLAVKRWVAGGIAGLTGGAGVAGLSGLMGVLGS